MSGTVNESLTDGDFRLAAQEYDPAVPIGSLREHPRNPNEGDVGAISQSMDLHGFVGAILVQRSSGYILSGNHTYRTAVAKGATAVPAFLLDIDDANAARLLMDINHAARLGRDDPALAAALLRDLLGEGGLPATYTGDDLDDLMRDLNPPPPEGFPEYGDDIKTEHTCPRCGYTFSGKGGKRADGDTEK